MDNRKRSGYYDGLILDRNPMAAAIGRSMPYHLAYLRKYRGTILLPGKTADPGKEEK